MFKIKVIKERQMNSIKERKAQFMRILFLSLGFLFIFCVAGYASEKPSYLLKENALGFKLGYHFFESSDFTDFWDIDEKDMNSFAFELAYERKVTRGLGIELAFGYFKSSKTYRHVVFVGDTSDIEIENFYLSPTLKCYMPANDTFIFYIGVGPDLYYTDGNYKYKTTGFSYDAKDDSFSLGVHGLAGVEWYIYKDPAAHGLHDAPVSLFLEYKYSWVNVDDADRKVIDDINYYFGTAFNKNDLDVGGH
ncbi:porin family protein, partial [bacterium]|nr:porin family protein [bacterium]